MKFKNKILAILVIAILIISATGVSATIEHGASVDALDETVEIEIDKSGSKNYYGIDNIVGAKNKIITKENKDYYEIRNYELDDGTTVELIYPNGKNNRADTKRAIVNGTETTQPRIYGKDGVTHIKINYDSYLHSEETVNYINNVTNHTTTVKNNLGRGDSWSQDGAAFDNQVANNLTINTSDGTYIFSHWINDAGETVHDFFIDWENGAHRTYNFFAIYDFIPIPDPDPVDNQTDDNQTIDNQTDNETIIPVDNQTDDKPVGDTNDTRINKTNTNPIMDNDSSVDDTRINKTNTNPIMDNNISVDDNSSNNTIPIQLLKTGYDTGVFLIACILLIIGLVCLRRYYS